MAITPSNWGRRVEITEIATSAVSVSGYVGLITADNLPDEIWSLAENGGGDLRVCLNSDGTIQLPLDVALFDTVAETAILWLRFPSFASGDSVWLFYDKSGESQPEVTDTYGRNAVWQDREFHSNDGSADSTGNAGTPTPVGGVSIGSATGGLGSATDFDGISDVINYGNTASVSGAITTYAWVNLDSYGEIFQSGQRYGRIIRKGSNYDLLTLDAPEFSDATKAIQFLSAKSNDNVVSLNVDQYLVATVDASGNAAFYVNGVNVGTASGVSAGSTNSNALAIGNFDATNTVDRHTDGRLWHIGVANSNFSADLIATEYANQSDPSTFWATGTPENTTSSTSILGEVKQLQSQFNILNSLISILSSASNNQRQNNNAILFNVQKALVKDKNYNRDKVGLNPISSCQTKDKSYSKDFIGSDILLTSDVNLKDLSFQVDSQSLSLPLDSNVFSLNYDLPLIETEILTDSSIKDKQATSSFNRTESTIDSLITQSDFQEDYGEVFLTSVVRFDNKDIQFQITNSSGEVITETNAENKDLSFQSESIISNNSINSSLNNFGLQSDYIESFLEITSDVKIKDITTQYSRGLSSSSINIDTQNIDLNIGSSTSGSQITSNIHDYSLQNIKSLVFYNLVQGIGIGKVNISVLGQSIITCNRF